MRVSAQCTARYFAHAIIKRFFAKLTHKYYFMNKLQNEIRVFLRAILILTLILLAALAYAKKGTTVVYV